MHRGRAVVKRLIQVSAAALLALGSAACGSTSVTQITAPDVQRCQTTLGTVPTVPAAGGKVEVGVVAARECAWTAASNSSWIQVSPTSGQGESSITLTATSNPQGTARNGNVSINGSQVAITQAASPCTFSVSPATFTIPAPGSNVGVEVTTLIGCSWTTSSPASWVTLSTASGSGSADITLTAERNNSTAPRSVAVTIAGRPVNITQAAATATPPPSPSPTPSPTPSPSPTPPSSCSYELDPTLRAVKGKGGDATVKVITSRDCPWTATSNVSWVQLKDEASGTGTHDVRYHVDKNESGFGRTGTITIADVTHVILQGANGD